MPFLKIRNSTSPKISVLMCVYNGEEYLSESIESVLNQTYSNIEFVICDDGSNDKTKTILSYYKKIDDRIVLLTKSNTGLTDSLKYASKFCSGEWIARQDADDISNISRLQKQLDYCIKKNVDFSTSQYVRSNGKSLNFDVDLAFHLRVLKYGNINVHGTFFFKSKIFKDVSYNSECRVAQDFDFILQVIKKGFRCGMCPEELYTLRIHNNSLSAKNSIAQTDSVIKSLERHNISSAYFIENKKPILKYTFKIIKQIELMFLSLNK
ncbi:glycosyltransferase family 2 protein [Shewanella frigidimarina]|uniref:glycosyltransferase family 2 protein n=1 Tax=Shewanella frigidimarina TaxID=56812 RepID=UPI000F4F8157|nr:glycosyltransferase family 2 protein [Shewanella frigidimarina]RPA38322.1 glycosyltransferase family 2 protein [Shewanella frigidimarina]